MKIGPIGARFKGAVALSDLDPPNGYTISGKGSGGVAGNAKGTAKVRLSADGAGTLLAYQVEAQVGGRMAQLGGPLIDATAKKMADKFFTKFGEVVGGEAAPAAAAMPGLQRLLRHRVLRHRACGSAATGAAGGFPWAWAIALGLAIIAGFLLGRSEAADWWVVAVVLLALVAAGAGYDAGRRSGGRPMKPAPFDYVAPTTIEEACAVLAEAGGGATVLAGGQTLMPLLNLRMSQPFILLDINKIAALKGISRTSGGIRVGPATRQCEALAAQPAGSRTAGAGRGA